jgi:hypothetical protein
MNGWFLLNLVILFIGAVFLLSTWKARRMEGPGTQQIFPHRDFAEEAVQEIIDKSIGGVLWVIAGELDPTFYRSIYDRLKKNLQTGKMFFEIIGGPRIVVDEEMFTRYVSSSGELRDGYWNAHPVLTLAYEFAAGDPSQSKVKLFIRKGPPVLERHCFCSSNESAPSITERAHVEYMRPPVLVERGTRVGYGQMRRRYDDLRASGNIAQWNPKDPESYRQIKLVRYRDLQKEAESRESMLGH